ncbi:MAG: class I SAM-dependent methyltransferase [Hyphomicrobium sp.]
MTESTAAAHAQARAMDHIYRYQRYVYDATRRYYLFGRNELLAELAPPVGGSVLEVGCGTARNLILAAERYPQSRYYGFDISAEMLKTARKSVEASGQSRRISLAVADATNFDGATLFGVDAFDRIFISYSLSMIPAWEAIIAHAADQLAPGGALHIVDFGSMDRMPAVGRRAMLAWLRRFSVTPRRDLVNVARRIARARGMSCGFRHGTLDYAAHATLRRA